MAVTTFLVAYFTFRFLYLSTGTPGLDERSSGFLLRILEPDELQQRFGPNPAGFYAYNVVTSVLSVLFSEPDGGVFETVRASYGDGIPPRLYVAVTTSALTTGLLGWAVFARLQAGRRQRLDDSDRLLVIAAVVIFANAVLSYAYTKHEIVSVAGAFYAVAAFVAAQRSLVHVTAMHAMRRLTLVILLAVLAVGWSFRSAGVHHLLRVQAFKVRNDWARVPPATLRDAGSPQERRSAALARDLRQGALDMPVTNAFRLPKWTDRWWGE